jgi:hypothetical protein
MITLCLYFVLLTGEPDRLCFPRYTSMEQCDRDGAQRSGSAMASGRYRSVTWRCR